MSAARSSLAHLICGLALPVPLACTPAAGRDADGGSESDATGLGDHGEPSTTSGADGSMEDASPTADSDSGATTGPGSDDGGGEPVLLQSSDFILLGSFRVPSGQLGRDENALFDYADDGLAFNPASGGLFIKGHTYGQLVAEISTPDPVASGDLDALPTATMLQPFADITEGHLGDEMIENGMILAGLMVDGDRLVGATWAYYDAKGEQTYSHFSGALTLDQSGDFEGLFTVGTVFPSFVAGHMTQIPAQWQAAFGGRALTGHCCTSIIGHQSWGPSAWVFDPAQLGAVDPVPATPVVYYDGRHPTLGEWGNESKPNPAYNMSTTMTGLVFPDGTRSVLFFGRTGLGAACYGEGTDDESLHGMPTKDGSKWCYDPADSYKGTHAYPYGAYVWAYDANDLLEVLEGAMDPWSVTPYEHWELPLPFDTGGNILNGAAFDAASNRLFVAQRAADEARPVIHVFELAPL